MLLMSRRCRRWALVVAAGAAASLVGVSGALAQPAATAKAGAAGAVAGAEELPIRKITLYRSGVGYFERAGSIRADAEVQLRFNTEQINDILKSMVVVLDPKAGRLDSISYGSKEPLARRLASFGVDISDNPSVPDLLGRLRGAPIKVVAGGDQITGTILGVESRKVSPGKDAQPYDAPHLNLVTQTGMRSIAISDVSSFELLDKDLAAELNKALASLAEYRADRSKTVNMRFSGASGGTLPVTVAYIHEMPVWKTSYRLVLPDTLPVKPGKDGTKDGAGGKAKGGQLSIQGWAIVENTTDHDWNDVKLSLVSGRPVSFQMDLYEPLYVTRPMVPVPTIPGVAPRAYAGGVDATLREQLEGAAKQADEERKLAYRYDKFGDAQPAAPTGGAAGRVPMRMEKDKNGLGEIPLMDARGLVDYSAAAQAQAGEIGEVFQYELEAPVTIERQRSAMIPLLNSTISGRRVSIFNLADRSEHPMRGVEIVNDSNLQLLPGPISVIDGADNKTIYAGDAQIGHVGQGDKRLLAYAVDLDVGVLTSGDTSSTVTHLKIVDGTIEQTFKDVVRSTYAFDNNDQKRGRTVIVEQARLNGWDLVEPKKAAEQTQELYRFEVEMPADKTGSLAVQQERVRYQRVEVLSIDRPTLLEYAKQGKVSEAVMKAVQEAAAKQSAINQAERAMKELDRQTAEIAQDQGRIRENMAKIDNNSQLYTRYMTKLTEQETQLEDLHQRRIKGQEQIEKLRGELAGYLKGLNVE